MKPNLSRAILVAAGLTLFAGSLSAQTADAELDVFFLGNSYIYFNNLPRLVEGVAESLDGPSLRVGSHTLGGYTLERHLNDGHVPDVFEPEGGEPWDRVILQEQSMLGAGYVDRDTGKLGAPTGFHAAARRVVEFVRARGAEPVFYMTWAKEAFPSQTSDLAAAYEGIGAELGAEVAPVGIAWARVREERPDVALFLPDGSHPDQAGSYLAACVIYAELTGHSPIGAGPSIEGRPWNTAGIEDGPWTTLVSLDPDLARYLQEVAWETVQTHAP